MYKIILTATAAILMTGSLANAQFLLGQNDRGHKQVWSLWAERSIGARHAPRRFTARIPRSRTGTGITATGRRVSPGFLLGQNSRGHKRVTNQYSGYSWPR